MSYVEVPAEFYAKKVCRCPCLTYSISRIYCADIREYSQILKAVLYCNMSPIQVFSMRMENKTRSILVCTLPLEQSLLAETKFLCTTRTHSDILFKGINR